MDANAKSAMIADSVDRFEEARANGPSFWEEWDPPSSHPFVSHANPTLVPENWPLELRRLYPAPFTTIWVDPKELRPVVEESKPLPGEFALMLGEALNDRDHKAHIRFGTRTAHDAGVWAVKSVEDIENLLRNSERAMTECWGWAAADQRLPFTVAPYIDFYRIDSMECRAQIQDGKVVAISSSMGDPGSNDVDERRNHFEWMTSYANDFIAPHVWLPSAWVDFTVHNKQVFLFDVNPDEGFTWPGWFDYDLDTKPEGVAWHGDRKTNVRVWKGRFGSNGLIVDVEKVCR